MRGTLKTGLFAFGILFFSAFTCTWAQNPQLQFDEASRSLNGNEFQDALTIYKDLESKQWESGELFLNMAYIYTQFDSLGLAKYYYLKAWEFSTVKSQAEEGLSFVESKMRYSTPTLPKLPWERALEALGKNPGFLVLAVSGAFLFNLFALIIAINWIWRRSNPISIGVSSAWAILGLFLIGTAFLTRSQELHYDQAVQVSPESKVFEEPNLDASLISNSYEGYVFTIDWRKSKSEEGWFYVRMSNGMYGWIQTESLRIL